MTISLRGKISSVTALFLWLGAVPVGVPFMSAVRAEDVSHMFGNRVRAVTTMKTPSFSADFDGDGTLDTAYFVTILPEASKNKFAKDVAVYDPFPWYGPLGSRGQNPALAIVQKSGSKKTILTCLSDSGENFFEYAINEKAIDVAKRGSKEFLWFQGQESSIKYDILLFREGAGDQLALYWNGQKYALWFPSGAE